ncbi:hypothetical protein COS55_01485 [Candidatus Shapirobacteria bacterium CG03_land_8_20_14_0_80_40_19]|uniref:LytR/CpsA/Psr regulator C-terminal domain-containing protein n=1 Tax=Candidatus Shapirobacteria bacterium CG03_land_8_20_14_0_80_40_19 TaxID=1974880 RepID=A0A2M7BEY0_9BACT|nr:MAG: hypothetical protein COS55_01485 [Candidatus Shapirobacteria bacterium CG03_land_8_20_14_0_80_40_19]
MAGKFIRKTKRHLNLYFVLVIVVGVFFFAGLRYGKIIKNSPFWYFGRINFALLGNQSVSIFSLEGNEARLLEFSPQEKIDLPRGFGEYELRKIYQLGELEKRGGQLSLETFQNSLNFPVVGYFYQDDLKFGNYTLLSDFKKIIGRSIRKKIKTNLNLTDLLILYFRTKRISPLLFKKFEYRSEMDDFFKDEQIRREALAVEILNGTQHQGLAQKAAELWENLGGRIIRVADHSEQLSQSLLIARGESNKSYSYEIMKHFFKPDCRDLNGEENRADMTLILGDDYWKNMTEKW